MSCTGNLMSGAKPCSNAFVQRVFTQARSQNGWLDRPVPDGALEEIWELTKWAPTSANCSPLRVKFVQSESARQQLATLVDEGNRSKVMAAPVTAILGNDHAFYDHFDKLFPHNPSVKNWFCGPGKETKADITAIRNGTIQAAFFMMAGRSVGLDCGPLSGFDHDAVDDAFWAGTKVKTNFLCGLGFGDPAKLFPRHPRFEFENVCEIL